MTPSPGKNDTLTASTAAGTVDEHPARSQRVANRFVPDAVAQRFLRIDDRYHFPDRTLAFVDRGSRLEVRSDNLEVVHSVVAILQAREWQSVKLSGAKVFRQRVWREATLHGIAVSGYAPTTLEMQQLQRTLDRQEDGAIAPNKEREPRSARSISGNFPVQERRPVRNGLRAPIVGTLLAHAAAPYRFDPAQRMSYFVRVATEMGERTLWGADLERALVESRSKARLGDAVIVTQRGRHPVTVRVSDRDTSGRVVGEKTLTAQRMSWAVETRQYAEALDSKAELLRSEMPAERMLAQRPDLAGAVLGLRLANRFAQQLTPRVEDQARVVDAIRARLADAIAQGRDVRIADRRAAREPTHHRGRSALAREDLEQPMAHTRS